MTGKTILIVEDNLVNQRLLQIVLRSYGYRLLIAGDGEQAVAVTQRELPHLILMDLQLPKMSGYEATQILKSNAATRHIPIVALTAHTLPEEKKSAEAMGFSGYITKPIDPMEFPEQIRKFLSTDMI